MNILNIVKIGGNVVDDPVSLPLFLDAFAEIPGAKVLVHGGGKLATVLAEQLGLPQTMVEGRRPTDADTLRVVTMVYAGWINKSLVAQLNARGLNALGLSGADARLLPASKRPVAQIDYGFVGDLDTTTVNTDFAQQCLSGNLTPVIAPISADAQGQLLNVNADTVARSLAIAMAGQYAVKLIYCFDQPGVMEDLADPRSLVPRLDKTAYAAMKQCGVVHAGMIPKLDNAFSAIEQGVQSVVLGPADRIQDLIAGTAGTTLY